MSALKFLTNMYNKSAMAYSIEKAITTMPNKLIKMTSRMLARVYAMILIVGNIAATQLEAAEAITELGEAISQKLEQSAYMHYNLKDILGDKLPISQLLLEEQIRRNQINA